jgi:UDP-N-acetyl-D-galactosamine dehydrogenase
VGGHCIGVDPYYLVYKAKELGYHPQIISAGRFINDSMGGYVAKQVVKKIIAQDKNVKVARVLLMGVTFKENVSDIRNSKVVDIVTELNSYGVKQIDIVDPYASSLEVEHEYGFALTKEPTGKYDAIIVAVNHSSYMSLSDDYFYKLASENCIFVDVKGVFNNRRPKGLNYWSL